MNVYQHCTPLKKGAARALIIIPSTKMVPLRWTKRPLELQIRNIFKQNLLLNHWSKFHIYFTWMFPMMPSFKTAQIVLLHQTGGLPELQIRNLLNDISRTTGPNSKWIHRIVPLDTLYQNCTNGSARLNKRACPELQKRNIFLLNHWSKFKKISQNCSS